MKKKSLAGRLSNVVSECCGAPAARDSQLARNQKSRRALWWRAMVKLCALRSTASGLDAVAAANVEGRGRKIRTSDLISQTELTYSGKQS